MTDVYTIPFSCEEEGAVVAARTSRSPHSFRVIAQEVATNGWRAFLETNVLGYGHDSVAEGAVVPWIFLEGVSDLAANIIATSDPQLRVQMTSTRFQDMSVQSVRVSPSEDTTTALAFGAEMKRDYERAFEELGVALQEPRHAEIPRKRTLQCDIARAKLPAGITTKFGIRGDARTLRDAINVLLGYTHVPEVLGLGTRILDAGMPYIDTLLNRHVTPAPLVDVGGDPDVVLPTSVGSAAFEQVDQLNYLTSTVLSEVAAWRQSKWRRRFRMPAGARAPHLTAHFHTDWGAYRDLRRNRTIHQSDVLPSYLDLPADPLWAFRELYPALCDDLDALETWTVRRAIPAEVAGDAYLAPMGALVQWYGTGHLFNWLYMLRSRSGATTHPAYALPVRRLMLQIYNEAPRFAAVVGLVATPRAPLGVDFADRAVG